MQRHPNHEINELAMRILRDSLPPKWVLNKFEEDYGKDFHLEPSNEEDGNLTGTMVIIQLKGQLNAEFNQSRTHVSYSLEKRFSTYYYDKVKEYPVFLVVVDVTAKLGWYVHIQPILDKDQKWRRTKTWTIKLPVENSLFDIPRFRQQIVEAQKAMKLLHPSALSDVIEAQNEKIKRIDSRFRIAKLFLDSADATPRLHLVSDQHVDIRLEKLLNTPDVDAKIEDLIGKGKEVKFEPGEVRIVGTKLFENIEKKGGSLKSTVRLPATVSFICRDRDGVEIAKLADVPGQFVGGMKELNFHGGFAKSPLSIEIGPMVPQNLPGVTSYSFGLRNWNGQSICKLAYFERLYEFTKNVQRSHSTEMIIEVDGNPVFDAGSTKYELGDLGKLNEYLELLRKTRWVCKHFGIDPIWTMESFTADDVETADEMYGVFCEGVYKQDAPKTRLKAAVTNLPAAFDKPVNIKLVSSCTYYLMGEKIEAGRIAHEFSEISVEHSKSDSDGADFPHSENEKVIFLVGASGNIKTVRVAEEGE